MAEMAKATVMVDNAKVRVTEWKFAPGAQTGHHRHEMDYVVVPMTTGDLLTKDANGEQRARRVAGEPYFREAGAEHNVFNPNEHEFVFIEIEIFG